MTHATKPSLEAASLCATHHANSERSDRLAFSLARALRELNRRDGEAR
jgi:hypothetical protein